MNKRERFLLFLLLGLVIVVGGWALYYFTYQKPMAALDASLASVKTDVAAKTQELDSSNAEIAAIYKRNPHLRNTPKLSLPELKVEPGKTKTTTDITRHVAQVQAEYESYISDLVRASGFTPASIDVSSKQDKTSSPTLPGKGPIYTKVSVNVACSGNLASIVRLLRAFYTENLLQEVHTLTLTKPGTIRQGTQPDALDVKMQVEALLVSGAEARPELKPTIDPKLDVKTLAMDKRDYDQILTKNMFLGKGIKGPQEAVLKEDPKDVFPFVKLTTVSWNGRRWEAYLYDQGKPTLYRPDDDKSGVFSPNTERPGAEHYVNLTGKVEFSIFDRYNNLLLTAKTVLIEDHLLVIDVNGKYYKMQTGDFLGPVLEKPLSNVDIKLLGLTPPLQKAEAPQLPDEKAESEKSKAAKDPMATPE
jgi:hypothetical protein